MNLQGKKVYVIIPAYNEANSIARVVHGVKKLPVTPVVIDDGSSDDTRDRALAAGAVALRLPINRGQGAALRTGFRYALECGADIVVTFDSDGQHQVEEIEDVLAPILEHRSEVVLGSRFLKGTNNAPVVRRMVLKAGILFTRMVSQIKVTDTHNGFRAFTADALSKLELTEDRMAHGSEIIDQVAKQELRFVEVPVTITYSDETLAKGQRSMNFIKIGLRVIFSKLFR